MTVKSEIPDLKTGSKMATTYTEKADALKKFFTDVFTREDLNTMPECPEKGNLIPLTEIVISDEKIE